MNNKFMLNLAKAILHEVDGETPGHSPDSYLPEHFVEALKAAIEQEEDGTVTYGRVHPVFQDILDGFKING